MITALLLVSRILESIPPDIYTVPDPDLASGGGGGGGGLAVSQKTLFGPLGLSLVQNKGGGAGSPGPLP